MTEVFPAGAFCWVELGTSDAAAARIFYSELLGLRTNHVMVGAGRTYTFLRMKAHAVAGLYALDDEQKRLGVSPSWLSYVLVDEVDTSANRATELGGHVMMGPFDVTNIGRMAFVKDPTGAVFALLEAAAHEGAVSLDNRRGMACWNELCTRDPETARYFYTTLFGWSSHEHHTPLGPYTIFRNDGRLVAGMATLSARRNDPASWIVYFAVEDCDLAARKAQSTGARLVTPPSEIPDLGRVSMLTDPQGAAFAMIRLNAAEP